MLQVMTSYNQFDMFNRLYDPFHGRSAFALFRAFLPSRGLVALTCILANQHRYRFVLAEEHPAVQVLEERGSL